jgi:hypothetical protein
VEYFTQDYPILPVRRRFWEYTLRALDQTGTDSQLRNQLSMVHKAVQSNLQNDLGMLIPADYLYFDLADKMLQTRVLPRKIHEKTLSWIDMGEDEQIKARACGLVFLINQLSTRNIEIGIKATVDTIADLMITDLASGSSALRSKLPDLLDSCDILMKIKDEYRIQTEENIAWLDDFMSQKSTLGNEPHRLASERDDRIKKKFIAIVGKVSLTQGKSKIMREFQSTFDPALPNDADEKIYFWVRNGWNVEENSVKVDARQSGNESPTIHVFIPKRSADDLRSYLIEYKASVATLEAKGPPKTPEGEQARAAMETRKKTAEGKINELLDEAFSGAKVFQSGGNEFTELTLKECILEAAKNSLIRLYSNFDVADSQGWADVYKKACQGSPDALKSVGHDGEPMTNPVCKAIATYIASGKKGSDIRKYFEGKDYGWSGDAVDGALQVLLVAGQLKCTDEHGKVVEPKDLERKQIGKVIFKLENVTVSAVQRIQIRKLFQKAGIKVEPGKELQKVNEFLEYMMDLEDKAGGDAPMPEKPGTRIIEEIRRASGNEQLISIFDKSEALSEYCEEWSLTKDKIETALLGWNKLKKLIKTIGSNFDLSNFNEQIATIEQQRLLLEEPSMVIPILRSLEDTIRKQISEFAKRYQDTYLENMAGLEKDYTWAQLDEQKKKSILSIAGITTPGEIKVGTYDELIVSLTHDPLHLWNDKIGALKGRFDKAREFAIKEIEPKTQTVDIPKRTLKNEQDIDVWLEEVGRYLKDAVHNGPIIIR